MAAGEQRRPRDQSAERERSALAAELQAAATRCHERFGGRPELATESEACVRELCSALERALGHGLRPARGPPAGFWPSVRGQLARHERERFGALRRVRTERGRGRAWLRAALNERSLEGQLRAALAPAALEAHYRRWAFLRQRDGASLLPELAAGLAAVLFAARVDDPELDGEAERAWAPRAAGVEPLIAQPELAGAAAPARAGLRRRVRARVISFDDEAAGGGLEGASVAGASPADAGDVVADRESPRWRAQLDGGRLGERLLTPLTDAGGTGSLMPVSPVDGALDELWANVPTDYLEKGSDEATEDAEEATEPVVGALAEADTSDVDALKSRLAVLNEIVEQAREDAVASKLQLARLQRQHQNHMEKHELQIQTLNRENELLRQQLRKYVTAVQLLKENSAKEDSPNYHKESEEYQIKLVQVAEMHAELMEFNARLTAQLNNKDKLVKLLQTELECLRGPINEEDVPNKAPFLIHIWIPSAFLTGQTSDIHHVYQIYIRIRDTEWNIYRRYAQFYALYRELRKQDSVVTSFEFPPKKTIGNKDSRFVEDRRQKLQQWLRRIVNRLSHCSAAFSSNPTKQTLITLLPFFGDLPPNAESRRNNSSGNTCVSSPQYMGL